MDYFTYLSQDSHFGYPDRLYGRRFDRDFESRHVRKPYYRHNTFGHPPYCRQLRYQPIRMSTAGHMIMTKTGPSQIPKASSHKFAIEKNFRHLMVKGQKEKIERLYKVKIEFLDKDESGQWVEIKGDIIDRRNAKIYCNSVCNPTTCSLVKLPEPLFQKCIEQIEHHTNASIKKVGNLGQYKVSGNSSSMALALSILSDVKDSGVLGTPAGNVWSATGKCSLTDAISKQNEKGEGKDENLSASSKGAARNSNSEVNSRSNNDNTDEMGRNIDPISTAAQTNLEKAEDNEKTGKAKTLSKNLFAPENLVDKQDTQMCLSKGEESVAEKSSQSELDKKDTVEGKPLDAEEHEVKESALDFSLPFENTSFSHDVIQSKKKSRASKRLSMSLLSLLNASNARMDNCLEAPDTVKRAILSCLESEDNRVITEDGVTLIDNDEDEDKCVDMSQIVISDEDDDDNDITVITLDETLVEVNNNESESEIQNDDIEHDYLRTNGATRDTDPENINSTKEEISENHEHISYIILDETIAEENKDPEISKCSDEHVDESVNTDVANKNKEAKNAKPSDNISGEIDEGGNDKTFITLDEYVEEGHADKSGNEKCADKDNSPNTNATTKDTKSEHVLKPEKEASKKSSEVCDELISSESVEENKENASSVKESGDSQNIDSNDNMVEKLDDKMIAKFTALRNKHKQMGEKKSSQKENIDCDAPKDVSIVLIDISDVSESNDEKSDSNKNKKMTTEAKKTSSDVSLPDEKSLEEGEIISSGSEEVGGTKIIGERQKRKSGNKVESKDVISKTKKIKLSKISHKYLPERYRTPYYNRAEAKMKEKEQKDKTEAVDNVANKKNKKRKKNKRKRKVEVIEIPSQSSDDSETFSKKVRKADVSRTPEVTHTSDREVRLVHVARTPEPFSKFDREHDAGRKLVPRTPMTPYLIGQSSLATRDKRYIVIDGSNVAMSHGNGKVFSCRGICLAVNYFRKRGHDLITVFLPQWRKCRPENPALMTEQHLLDKLEREGYLVFTPSRRIGRKLVAAYDDRFILELAEREDGIVVSNDNFRDLKSEKWSWRRVIEDRLLMYSFARDHFMVPEDPLGRHGPTLDRFLRH